MSRLGAKLFASNGFDVRLHILLGSDAIWLQGLQGTHLYLLKSRNFWPLRSFFVAAACVDVFMPKTADPRISADGLGCRCQCLTVWSVGSMIWSSFSLFARRFLALYLPMSRSFVGMWSINPALTSEIHSSLYQWRKG